MLIQRFAERKINASIYFRVHTQDCSSEKLAHLLYLLDFEQFRQTGRSFTNDVYIATAEGPISLRQRGLPALTTSSQDVTSSDEGEHVFNDEHLTPRNMRILGDLCALYVNSPSEQILKDVCMKDGPWSKTYLGGLGADAVIDYTLALDGEPNREMILESKREHDMFVAAWTQSSPTPA